MNNIVHTLGYTAGTLAYFPGLDRAYALGVAWYIK